MCNSGIIIVNFNIKEEMRKSKRIESYFNYKEKLKMIEENKNI